MTRKSKFESEEARLASIKASRRAYKERTKDIQSEYFKKYYAENKESMIRHNVEYARKKRSEKPKIEKPEIEKPNPIQIDCTNLANDEKEIQQKYGFNMQEIVNISISVAKDDAEKKNILKVLLGIVSQKIIS